MNANKLREGKSKSMAPNSLCASLLKFRSPKFIVIIILVSLLNAGQVARSRSRTAHAQRRSSRHQSDINSGCDLLFAGNTGAQDFCQCRDPAPIEHVPGGGEPQHQPQRQPPPAAALNDDLLSGAAAIALSQLDCRHDNASELIGALARALAATRHQSGSKVFKLDYLNIQTQVTYDNGELEQVDAPHHYYYLAAQVHQLTVTLEVTGRARASNAAKFLANLSRMLFQPDLLQSLTLVIIETPDEQSDATNHPPPPPAPLKLNNLLKDFTSLNRLEISVSVDGRHAQQQQQHHHHHHHHQHQHQHQHYPGATALELDSSSLSAQAHCLQWLNLASNSWLNVSATPLARLSALEYLSLESSHLSAFNLRDHFASQLHVNLSSINLAHNELSSLERDLLCCSSSSKSSASKHRQLRMASLSQLDLSNNRLTSISSYEARSLLLMFPQLANLYLQHNQIIHLNLNALLGGAGWQHLVELKKFQNDKIANSSTFHAAATTTSDDPISMLEFIDLSHNELVALTAFSLPIGGKSTNGPRIKSINLAHNRLRQPVSLIDPKLINLLIFDESLEIQQANANWPIINLNNLGSMFDLTGADGGKQADGASSLCNYLSFGLSLTQDDRRIDEGFFVELLLDHNRIARLERVDFAGASCQRLETLALNDNSIAHIEAGAFDLLSHLQMLDLSGNQLVEIGAGLLERLLELRVLNLAGNKLAKLSFLLPLVNLQELYLQDNALESWHVALNATSSLRILDLSRNKLAHLPANSFNHLNELTYLNLEGNKQLKQFNWIALFKAAASGGPSQNEQREESPAVRKGRKRKKKQQQVAHVSVKSASSDRKAHRRRSARSSDASDMQDNDDDELDYSHSATASTTASAVYLKDNQLAMFGAPPMMLGAAPIHCDSLTTTVQVIRILDLSHNSISELANDSLACFQHLELLDLSFNQLRTLNEFALEQLEQLRRLYVANNYLVQVNLLSKRLLPRLSRLDLSQNQLSSMSLTSANAATATATAAAAAWPRQLEQLNLSDNYNLKLDSSELLALLRASSSTHHRRNQLKLARIASIWTNALVNDSALQFDLELEMLDLGQVSRIDSNFWKYLASGRLRVERLALCPPTRENFTLHKLLEATKPPQLDLSRCQLTSLMLKRALELGPETPGEGGGGKRERTSSVVRLNLSHNKLSEWPPLVGGHLLAHLDLSYNKLTGPLFWPEHNHTTTSLDQLEYLNLSSNTLASFCQEEEKKNANDRQCQQVVASSMPQLRHLDLSRNKLIVLTAGDWFHQWKHLETLGLGNNRLAPVVAPSLGERGQHAPIVSRLRLLDLSSNGQANAAAASSYLSTQNGLHHQDVQDDSEDNFLSITTPSNLIIHKDEQRAVIGCSQLSEFIRVARRHSSVHPIAQWARAYESEKMDYFGHDEQSSGQGQSREPAVVTCPMLRELKLDNSTWSGLNLVAGPLVALSSSLNEIRSIGEISSRLASKSRARVIYLDLSRNAIESLGELDEVCSHFPNLQTLELANQANLQEVSVHHLARIEHTGSFEARTSRTCRKLAYVNLSNNKLRLIKPATRANQSLNSLVALRLDHNHLQDFTENLLLPFPNLRYLDLRFNQLATLAALNTLASITLADPLLDLMLDDHSLVHHVNRYKFELTRDTSALKISTATVPAANQTLRLEMSSSGGLHHVASSHLVVVVVNYTSHVLRFCTLNRTELYKVCLHKRHNANDGRPQASVCFALKPPSRGPSCTTNLGDHHDGRANNNNSAQTRTESLMSSGNSIMGGIINTISSIEDGQPPPPPPLPPPPHDDLVLSFIDQLKWAWIRVKHFSLAAYLAQVSQVKQDSVLVIINERHPIYTLTVIKLGLVLAALGVILLSIAMFALLTATIIGSGGDGDGASSKRQKLRRQNKVSDRESVESSYGQATLRAPSKGDADDETTTTTTAASGGGATKSHDTSEGSRYSQRTLATTSGSSGSAARSGSGGSNLDTVREAEHGLQVGFGLNSGLGNAGAGQHQQLFQHTCSTPSSSLAPSSVETGETMQAVDSLGSCSFTRAQRQEIYDSQRTLTAASGHAHYNSVDQYQQQAAATPAARGAQVSPPAPPVATVMRMVKSSTFDGMGTSIGPTDLVCSGFGPDHLRHEAQKQQQHCNPNRGFGNLRNHRQLYSGAFNYSSLSRPPPGAGCGPKVNTTGGNRLSASQQQSQIYVPAESMSFGGDGVGGGAGELDPVTMSLLSLNSQLSGGASGVHGANNGSSQLANLREQVAPSLCQYHTRQQAIQRAHDRQQQKQQDHHRELLLLADELQHRHNSAAAAAASGNGTLFELEEELQLADWPSGCDQQEDTDFPAAPPPPAL